MSNTVLRIVVIIDAAALLMFGIGRGLALDGSVSLAVAIVAAAVLQLVLALKGPWGTNDSIQRKNESFRPMR
ncbi:hypothetical protein SAMN06295974_2053 [Plantibacter flavus]|uniref:Uncharacterized protein n=1 Tax=Plantibacter flavus TaxID=150123 RepID=A0A3N2BZX2_9MICO|nr:hypothetical protein [Plantibacter flavus]ROR80782.1 hypothetical protein EDD42_0825 [Plantibacter flavus]SMG31311.1 hypothetical protein SAMN06295974_2053 [Plantibacter flavus]